MTAIVQPGTAIAVVAPSGRYDEERFAAGLSLLKDAGHTPVAFPDMLRPHRYLAAPDDKRFADLLFALRAKKFSAVWIARGGYGITRLLSRIPWSQLTPKPIIGFSDATPLLEMARRRFGMTMVHGPVVHSLADTSPIARKHLFALLAGEPTQPLKGETWASGTATGPLVGGNLAMLAATCGTPWQVKAEGAILALEEIGEVPYRVDRMLQQLRDSGLLDRVAGVAVGSFTRCDAPKGADWSVLDVVREALDPLSVPVVAGLPFGHDRDNRALPIGARATLADGTLSWTLGAPPEQTEARGEGPQEA